MMARWLLAACLAALSAGAGAAGHAVILLYHHISDSGPDSTRVSPARFAEHLDLITERGYRVLPLAQVLEGVYGDAALPPRAVALTFDDAWRSVGEVAFPLLRERAMPFTVFVATDAVDAGGGAFLDWPGLRAMAGGGLATFGPHSLSHAHLESLRRGGGAGPVAAEREREIDGSLARLRAQLGAAVIDAFAYPYGEYSQDTEALLAARGLYGLAQQSGAVGPATRATRIPRFPLYVGGDSDSRLETALAARPLAVSGADDAAVFYPPGTAPSDPWRLRPAPGPYRRAALACYAASGEALALRWSGEELAVALPHLRPGRNKVNCTAPATDREGYFWHSRLWLIADEAGRWLQN